MPNLLPTGKQSYSTNAGDPLVGGRLYTYEAGTNVPKATYSDALGLAQNTNPVILDARGEATVFWSGNYKVVLRDASGNLIWTIDNVNAVEAPGLRADLSNTTDTAAGDALLGVRSVFTGGVGRTQHDKNADSLHAADFGATGAGDDTAALKAMFDAAIPAGRTVTLRGNYTVSGPITSNTYASGSLNIHCDGPVTITVNPAAAVFTTLIGCYTPTANNDGMLTGGKLTLVLNDRCSNGLIVRSDAATTGGVVHLGPLTVTGAKENDSGATAENQGVLIVGRYASGVLWATNVDGVDRMNPAGGACKGISISGIDGPFVLVAPQVSRVLCGPGTNDADGISVFGRDIAGTYATRGGSVTILNPVVTDCKGRSFKTQISQSTIVSPIINRRSVVAFNTADIDHQVGGVHEIINPVFTYRKNGATSPIPTGWRPISLQQQCTDRTGRMRVTGGAVRTEVAFEQLAFLTVGASSLGGEVEIADVDLQALGALATTVCTRAVLELDAGQVQAATGPTHVTVRGLRGNLSGVPLLGYTGASVANTSKLSWEVADNENTGADAAGSVVFTKLSGLTTINQVGRFLLRNNTGFADFLGAWVFDYLALRAGTVFTYDRVASGAGVTNGPVLTGAYPRVEALGSVSNGNRDLRVMEDTGAALKIHFRQAAAWRNV